MLEIKVDISDRMLRYSSISNLMNVISNEVVEAFANTLDSLVLNGDTVLTATGNINSDDQAPATTYGADHHTLIDN
jgi:HK97 family phage major capsid protein